MPRQMITYADFRGGLNTDSANDILADNELVVAENVDLLDRGALTKRAGLSKYNATPYTVGGVAQVIEQLIAWDGQLFAVHCNTNPTSQTPRTLSLATPTVLTAITSGEGVRACVAGRKLLVLNNGKSDVGVFGGVPAPILKEIVRTSPAYESPTYKAYDLLAYASKPTVAKSGADKFTKGLYAYVVRLVNEIGYESAFRPEYGVATVDAGTTVGQFTLSNIAIGPTGTVARKIYRSDALPDMSAYLRGDFPMYLVTTIADNTTTTYADTLSTSILVLQPQLTETDNIILGKAGAAAQIEWHPPSSRFFATGVLGMQSAILYSEPMRIDYWKSTSVMHGMGKESVAPTLQAFGDAMMAFYPDSVYAWRGYDATDATWEQLALQANSVEKPTLTPDSVTVVADNGIYAIPMAGYRGNIAMLPGSDNAVNIAEGRVRGFLRTLKSNRAAFWPLYDTTDGKYLLRYKCGVPPYAAGVLVFDWQLKAFTHYTGWDCAAWCRGHDGTIYLATGGQIRKVDSSALSDDGAVIPVSVRTKGYGFSIPAWKWVQKILVSFVPEPTLTSTISGKVDTGYETLTIPAFTWDAKGSLKQKSIPIHKKGQWFAVEFNHDNTSQPFALYSVSFVFQPLMPRGL